MARKFTFIDFSEFLKNTLHISIGNGKTIVELCSALIELKVWRKRNCNAAGASEITWAALFSASDDCISPSAEIILKKIIYIIKFKYTFALASRVASASAAIAYKKTCFLKFKYDLKLSNFKKCYKFF